MNKQIEEMAKDIEFCDRNLVANCHNVKCKECRYFYSKEDCYMLRLSEMLIAKGYRKASDVALEVIKKVEQILTVKIIGIEEDLFHGTAAHWDGTRRNCYEELLVELAELKKKYESEGADDED